MSTRRRQFLITLGVGGAAATGGCLNRLPWIGDDSNTDNEDEDEGEPTQNQSNAAEEEQSQENESGSETGAENESEPEPENEPENETNNESESEPVEDSTRPESVEIDDAVEADIKFDQQEDTGVAVWGTVENVTPDPIDQVSVTVWLYDGEGNTLFEQTDGTVGLASWSSWEFEIVTRDKEVANQCESYDIEIVAEQLN